MTVPTHVSAGGTAAISFTVINQGAAPTVGRWKDNVYLSLDSKLTADDILVGSFDNGTSLDVARSTAPLPATSIFPSASAETRICWSCRTVTRRSTSIPTTTTIWPPPTSQSIRCPCPTW